MKLYSLIQAGGYDTSSAEWNRVSEGGRKFLRDLLNVKPTKRLCCEEALEHPWIKTHVQKVSVKGDPTLVHFSVDVINILASFYPLLTYPYEYVLCVLFRLRTHEFIGKTSASRARCITRGNACANLRGT